VNEKEKKEDEGDGAKVEEFGKQQENEGREEEVGTEIKGIMKEMKEKREQRVEKENNAG
jgi:hypothetical protein